MTDSRSSKAIEAEIERTRSRIEQRFENMSADLTPTHLVTKALGTNPNNTQETVNAVIEKARTNPLSALLIGAGIAGLFLANKNDQRSAPSTGPAERDEYDLTDPMVHGFNDGATPEERIAHNAAHLEAQARGVVTNASAAVSDAGEALAAGVAKAKGSARQTISEAGAALSEAVETAKQTANESVGNMRATAQEHGRSAYISAQAKAGKVPTQARIAGDLAVGWVKENPVPAGLLALAAGAAVASIFATSNSKKPRTRTDAGRELYDLAEQDAQLIPTATPAPTDVMPSPMQETAPAAKPRKRAAPKKASSTAAAKPAKGATPKKQSAAKTKLNGSKALKRATAVLGEPDGTSSKTQSLNS